MTVKDISAYIDIAPRRDGLPGRSIRSLLDVPITVLRWEVRESKYRDGNPSGSFVRLEVDAPDGRFYVNSCSGIISEQLGLIEDAKEKVGDSCDAFTCVVRKCGKGVKMFPSKEV